MCTVIWTYLSSNVINPLKCFFDIEGHVALDRNLGPGHSTLLVRMIPGDLLSACPHRHAVPHTTQPLRQLGCTVKLLPHPVRKLTQDLLAVVLFTDVECHIRCHLSWVKILK